MDEQEKQRFIEKHNRTHLCCYLFGLGFMLFGIITLMAIFEIIESSPLIQFGWFLGNAILLGGVTFAVLRLKKYDDFVCPNCYTDLLEHETRAIQEHYGDVEERTGKIHALHVICPNCGRDCRDIFNLVLNSGNHDN